MAVLRLLRFLLFKVKSTLPVLLLSDLCLIMNPTIIIRRHTTTKPRIPPITDPTSTLSSCPLPWLSGVTKLPTAVLIMVDILTGFGSEVNGTKIGTVFAELYQTQAQCTNDIYNNMYLTSVLELFSFMSGRGVVSVISVVALVGASLILTSVVLIAFVDEVVGVSLNVSVTFSLEVVLIGSLVISVVGAILPDPVVDISNTSVVDVASLLLTEVISIFSVMFTVATLAVGLSVTFSVTLLNVVSVTVSWVVFVTASVLTSVVLLVAAIVASLLLAVTSGVSVKLVTCEVVGSVLVLLLVA